MENKAVLVKVQTSKVNKYSQMIRACMSGINASIGIDDELNREFQVLLDAAQTKYKAIVKEQPC